ncbi:MAG: radical SAM protein [Kiritimatiellae bacterium]|nr:radical SAM protein [Kiritimatiellia bacterium]
MKNESIALVSLGCAKNAVDLQVMAGKLVKGGCTLSPDPDRADVVIVNTCSFIAAAREEAEAEIVRAIELKRRGQYGRVVVTGCYPQRYPELKAAFPGVDEWIGVPGRWEEPAIPALRFTGKAFAYLKIAEGCAHRCAYCAIPAIRGKYRSRPAAAVLREAKALVASGCRELNVIAQDPLLYGVDFGNRGGRRRGIVQLLREIDRIPGDFWVRVLYCRPEGITREFINWMLESPHAVRYIDVPIQHTVPAVLKKMNRLRSIAASRSVAETLRAAIPDVTLRTTVMTGFPGESENRFHAMLDDLNRMQFDHLGAFAFSPERGTPAFGMRGRPSAGTAREREKKVMAQQRRIWSAKAARMTGAVRRALVVAPGVARMASQAPDVDGVVCIDRGEVGEFVTVRLLKTKGFDFIGEAL